MLEVLAMLGDTALHVGAYLLLALSGAATAATVMLPLVVLINPELRPHYPLKDRLRDAALVFVLMFPLSVLLWTTWRLLEGTLRA